MKHTTKEMQFASVNKTQQKKSLKTPTKINNKKFFMLDCSHMHDEALWRM